MYLYTSRSILHLITPDYNIVIEDFLFVFSFHIQLIIFYSFHLELMKLGFFHQLEWCMCSYITEWDMSYLTIHNKDSWLSVLLVVETFIT
jgi:hypothetical protein